FFTVGALAWLGNDLYAAPQYSVARWNGSTRSTIGSGMDYVGSLLVSGTNLIAGGSFVAANGTPANRIAKWDGNSRTPLGSGFGIGFGAGVSKMALVGSDLIVVGNITYNAPRVARWEASNWSWLTKTNPGSGISGQEKAFAI